MSAPDLRADARYVIAYYEDACVTGAKGPCPAENAAVRVAEALLVRLDTPPVQVFVLCEYGEASEEPLGVFPTLDMARDEGLRLAQKARAERVRWDGDDLTGWHPECLIGRRRLFFVRHFIMGATSSPEGANQ